MDENLFKNLFYYVSMTLTLKKFYEKYGLDNFEKEVDIDKVELVRDFEKILKQICNFIDLLTRSHSIWSGELMLSVALLHKEKYPPVKNQVADCMEKRSDNLKTSYRHLKENNYIKIEKDGRRKRVLLNKEEFPEFHLISEIMQRFWKCRKVRKEMLKEWRES